MKQKPIDVSMIIPGESLISFFRITKTSACFFLISLALGFANPFSANSASFFNVNEAEKPESKVTFQQKRTITGKVTDDVEFPLPNVTIIASGTTIGTTTDREGNYTLDLPAGAEVLVFSFIGMETQEIAVEGRSIINVVMVEATTGLDEIMVVGYGTQANRKVSAAISQVTTRELEIAKRPVTDTQNALIGAIPGLILTQVRGEPGSTASIRVRESSALTTAGRTAMVLIDGFEGSLSDVSPNDIASVTVLKDAAATAIYGARGANGVVLITTKKTRRNERLSLTYNFNHSRQRPAGTPEISNSTEFMEFNNEAVLAETLRNNPGTDPSTIALPFSQADLQRARSGFYPETQWVDELYSENAGQTSHNITINGGSQRTGYLVNLGSLSQNGLIVGSDNFRRYNLRLKIDTDITDWLSVGTNASVSNRKIDNVPYAENYTIRGRPFFPVQTEEGIYVDKGASTGTPNPVGNAYSGSYDRTKVDGLNLQLYGQLKPIKGLTVEERVSITNTNNFREIWETPYEYAILDMELNQVGGNIMPQAADRRLLMRSTRTNTLNTLTTGRYELQLNNQHNFNVLAGIQTQEGESMQVEAERLNFILPNLQDLKLGLEITGLGNSSEHGGNRTTLSYFGRFGYDFRGRYLAEFNFRADASSNFGPNNKWGYFPAVSVGWNVGDEPFMEMLDFINILKIRASWGVSGDDGSINVVESAPFVPLGASLGGIVVPYLRLGNSINPDLKWETSEKINIGLDSEFGRGLFGISAEYFIDYRSDIITQLLTSIESGLGGVLDNVYDAKSWGWEFDLSHKSTVGKIMLNASFNLSYYNSEITNTEGISPLNTSSGNYQDVGLPIRGNWYGWEVDGFFDTQAEMDANVDASNNPINQAAVSTGDSYGRYLGGFKYVDQVTVDTNGDGIPDAKDGVVNADDRVILRKNTGDNFRTGFSVGAAYGGFYLSARFYGVLKGLEWWNSGNVLKPFTGDAASYTFQTDTWRPDNTDALFPEATASNVDAYQFDVDYLIHKNSYIKLKNINMGYTFNQDLIDKIKYVSGLDVYVSVENLGVIWSNNPAHDFGWDPELGTGNFNYPLPVTMSVGVNVKF